MGTPKVLILYFITLVISFTVDLIWLSLMNSHFYKIKLAGLMADKINWLPAILFYLLFVVGLILLVVLPALDRGSWLRATMLGGLFGMVAYSTYDLSNAATLKNWPVILSIVDILWGTTFSALIATISYFIANALQ